MNAKKIASNLRTQIEIKTAGVPNLFQMTVSTAKTNQIYVVEYVNMSLKSQRILLVLHCENSLLVSINQMDL